MVGGGGGGGLCQNGNSISNIQEITPLDTISSSTSSLMEPRGGSGFMAAVGNSQVANPPLDEFTFTQPAPVEYGGSFQTGEYVAPGYQQTPVCFRPPLETEGFAPEVTPCCYATAGTYQAGGLGNLFKSVGFSSPAAKVSSNAPTGLPFAQNLSFEQEASQKTLPSLSFNPIYSTICFPPPQRLAFDSAPQQAPGMAEALQQHPPQPVFQNSLQQRHHAQRSLPTSLPEQTKLRSQNGLIELLGSRSQKAPEAPFPVRATGPKPLIETDISTNDNTVPRSSYMCRKCRAHGRLIAVRQHKRNCPYKHCSCSVCSLVNYGRHIVARQIALYRDQKNQHADDRNGSGKSRNGGAKNRGGDKNDMEDDGPHCRRCRNHGKTNPWKGHKKVCPFYYCICQQCILITLRKSNEKNLREVVQESNKDFGIKSQRKHSQEEAAFSNQLYNNKKSTKGPHEKREQSQNHQLQQIYPDAYALGWNALRDHGETAVQPNLSLENSEMRFLPTCVQEQDGFYGTNAHKAAAFAAAAAVAFQQDAVAPTSSVEAGLQVLKEESHASCVGGLEYPASETWHCTKEVKKEHSPKEVANSQMQGMLTQNGAFETFWQAPFRATGAEEPFSIDVIPLTTCQPTMGAQHFDSSCVHLARSQEALLPHKADSIG